MGESIPRVEWRRRRLKKISMYSKTSVLSSAFDGHERPWMSSFLSVAKKLSATALSKQSPLLPIDWAMPAARARWPKASETNWLPWSECQIRPGSGRRCASAIPNASGPTKRHFPRVGDQFGAHVIGHAPAHNPAAVDVLDGDEVQPAFPGSEVG